LWRSIRVKQVPQTNALQQRNLDQLIKKANEIDFDLSQEYKRIDALILEKRQKLKSIFKSQQNEDLYALLMEIKQS
jgi:hypothetical protein